MTGQTSSTAEPTLNPQVETENQPLAATEPAGANSEPSSTSLNIFGDDALENTEQQTPEGGDADPLAWLNNEQELSSIREKYGISADPKEYKPTLSEGVTLDPTVESIIREAGVKYAIPPKIMGEVLESLIVKQEEILQTQTSAEQKTQLSEHGALRKEWGENFAENCRKAKNAALNLAGKAGIPVDTIKRTGIGDNAAIIRLFAAAADAMGEDTIRGGNTSMPQSGAEEAHKIESDPTHRLHEAYMNSSHADHKRANDLYNRLVGIK